MKLSNFKVQQLSTSELQNVTGGQMMMEEAGTTSTTRRNTSCNGSDHDSSRRDSD